VKKLKPKSRDGLQFEGMAFELNHRNLVQYLGLIPGDEPQIIMEYCSGGNLYDKIRKTPGQGLSWRQRIKVLNDIAQGMVYLHLHNVMHRDLKSMNVLLVNPVNSDRDEIHAKIADFGLARSVPTPQSRVQADSFGRRTSKSMTRCAGTWRWMAPEVMHSDSYNEKADVYSFAMLMYEVIFSEVPFADEVQDKDTRLSPEIGKKIVEGWRPSLKTLPKGCPPFAQKLISQCWDEDPESRPAFRELTKVLNEQLKLLELYDMMKAAQPRSREI
jgi:serine/threonine protein kinase